MWLIILIIIGVMLIKFGTKETATENNNHSYAENSANLKTAVVRKNYPVIDWEASWKTNDIVRYSGKCGVKWN